MGASDYTKGYQAYLNGEDFDDTRTELWQDGWGDALADDLDGCYDEDLDYGE